MSEITKSNRRFNWWYIPEPIACVETEPNGYVEAEPFILEPIDPIGCLEVEVIEEPFTHIEAEPIGRAEAKLIEPVRAEPIQVSNYKKWSGWKFFGRTLNFSYWFR